MMANATMDDYYRSMEAGDFDHVVALHDPAVTCWMSGQSLVSGRFEGREALYAHMGEHVLGPLVVGSESYVKGYRIALVDGPITVGLLHGGLPAKDGGRYDQFYLQVVRFENGLIREIVELFDTVMVETALMQVQLEHPRPAAPAPFVLDAPSINSTLTRAGMQNLAQRIASDIGERNFPRFRDTLTENAELRVIGSTPLSGRTREPAVLEQLFGGGLSDARVVAASGSGAVILARSGDEAYPQQYGILVEADGDKVGCMSIFFDTVAAEQFLFGNRILPAASQSIRPPFDVTKALTVER